MTFTLEPTLSPGTNDWEDAVNDLLNSRFPCEHADQQRVPAIERLIEELEEITAELLSAIQDVVDCQLNDCPPEYDDCTIEAALERGSRIARKATAQWGIRALTGDFPDLFDHLALTDPLDERLAQATRQFLLITATLSADRHRSYAISAAGYMKRLLLSCVPKQSGKAPRWSPREAQVIVLYHYCDQILRWQQAQAYVLANSGRNAATRRKAIKAAANAYSLDEHDVRRSLTYDDELRPSARLDPDFQDWWSTFDEEQTSKPSARRFERVDRFAQIATAQKYQIEPKTLQHWLSRWRKPRHT